MSKATETLAKGVLFAVLLGGSGLAGAAGKALGNADVEKMVAAKLAPQTIVMTIRSSPSQFDTSPEQLIRLSKAGVSQDVIEAMIAAGGGDAAAGAAAVTSAGEVVLVDGDKRVSMRYTAATLRTAVRALGWGGAATYAALPGPQAQLRVSEPLPGFEVAVPNNARPEGQVTLARLEPRKNGTREVSIAGGAGFSYSTGIHPDRIIATTISPLPGGAPAGHTLYRVTPSQALAPGEYALVSAVAQAPVSGLGQSVAAGNYFDFGVD